MKNPFAPKRKKKKLTKEQILRKEAREKKRSFKLAIRRIEKDSISPRAYSKETPFRTRYRKAFFPTFNKPTKVHEPRVPYSNVFYMDGISKLNTLYYPGTLAFSKEHNLPCLINNTTIQWAINYDNPVVKLMELLIHDFYSPIGKSELKQSFYLHMYDSMKSSFRIDEDGKPTHYLLKYSTFPSVNTPPAPLGELKAIQWVRSCINYLFSTSSIRYSNQRKHFYKLTNLPKHKNELLRESHASMKSYLCGNLIPFGTGDSNYIFPNRYQRDDLVPIMDGISSHLQLLSRVPSPFFSTSKVDLNSVSSDLTKAEYKDFYTKLISNYAEGSLKVNMAKQVWDIYRKKSIPSQLNPSPSPSFDPVKVAHSTLKEEEISIILIDLPSISVEPTPTNWDYHSFIKTPSLSYSNSMNEYGPIPIEHESSSHTIDIDILLAGTSSIPQMAAYTIIDNLNTWLSSLPGPIYRYEDANSDYLVKSPLSEVKVEDLLLRIHQSFDSNRMAMESMALLKDYLTPSLGKRIHIDNYGRNPRSVPLIYNQLTYVTVHCNVGFNSIGTSTSK
jgi:hypothetical protein